MKVLLETHLGRNLDTPPLSKTTAPQRKGAVLQTHTKQAVWEAIPEFHADIGPDMVLRKLQRKGHQFTAGDKKKAISEALQKLCKEGKLTRVRKGTAGKSNLYRAAQ